MASIRAGFSDRNEQAAGLNKNAVLILRESLHGTAERELSRASTHR
jgi:hypothetical protein